MDESFVAAVFTVIVSALLSGGKRFDWKLIWICDLSELKREIGWSRRVMESAIQEEVE
jgi:hypothetical protein